MTRDISEGRASRSIAIDIGFAQVGTWTNTDVSYDVAVGGVPFLLKITDAEPYERATVPFRKQQFDTQRDPGEQSLTNWWIRSQSSFHAGAGVNFYDPFANPFSTSLASNSYRYKNSCGVNVWSNGDVSLLNQMISATSTVTATQLLGAVISGVDSVLVKDGNKIKIVQDAGTSTLVDDLAVVLTCMATDGTNVYFLDANNVKSIALTGGASSVLWTSPASITSGVMGWVKGRLVAGINNKIYEIVGTGGALVPIYTHPNSAWVWTAIGESGPAIYASGKAGTKSSIYKFILTTAGVMPVLTSGITAATMPDGETIEDIYVYMGTYMCIGTSKGMRVGLIDPNTGGITYGPLIVSTTTPVKGFVGRDSFVWFGTQVLNNITKYTGTLRIDLSNEIDTLKFAYAQDVYVENLVGTTVSLAFVGATNRLAILAGTVATNLIGDLGLFFESATGSKYPSGYLQTGLIRYNTLEPKNYKRIFAHGDFGTASIGSSIGASKGSLKISSVDVLGVIYDIVTYDNVVQNPETNILFPIGAQDAMAILFTFNRDATDPTLSPILRGYQLKAVPATPKSRLIKMSLMCFDDEKDRFGNPVNYAGSGRERLFQLEALEGLGDVLTVQDFRTNESVQCLIEDMHFVNATPPNRLFDNFGGTITITVRTV